MSFEQTVRESAVLADLMDQFASQAGELGLPVVAGPLHLRAAGVRDGRFRVVVVGGFSRGKSTLLNALLGSNILPQKVVPSTAIITVIDYAEQPRVRVRSLADPSADGSSGDPALVEEVLSVEEFSRRYVLNEEDMSDGRIETDRFSRVDHAVLSYPVELCRNRVELVDSPGLQDDPIRTARTKRFLKRADAIVMVLDATALLTSDEVHFLDTVLLPEGFRNIFFVINKWNLVADSVLDPRDASREYSALEQRIRDRLVPFCQLSGRDRSRDRIFRLNALGALRARMRGAAGTDVLEETMVPAFERALQHFLVEERTRARNDLVIKTIANALDEVERFIQARAALAVKDLAEIEAEWEALQPKLERLRGIRQHITGFLDTQSANLQDRLVISFKEYVTTINESLPEAVDEFDLTPITRRSMVWAAITDWTRDEENKLARVVERTVGPQAQHYLERRLTEWRTGVVRNEMATMNLEVLDHLRVEAAEYQRVMNEIEERLGVRSEPLPVQELVERWLMGADDEEGDGGGLQISGVGVFGDLAFALGTIALDIGADMLSHAMSLWVPVVGIVISAVRMLMREGALRREVNVKIVEAVRDALRSASDREAGEIRDHVKAGFNALKEKISTEIDREIAVVAASLEETLRRRSERESSAEEERAALHQSRVALVELAGRIREAISPTAGRADPHPTSKGAEGEPLAGALVLPAA
jgi:GTPase SAR1 family protein